MKRSSPLGALETVTGADGEPFIAYTPAAGRSGMLGLTAGQARESARVLLACADEIERAPVQLTLGEVA